MTIAHGGELVQAGLAATLRRVPEFDVRVWGEAGPVRCIEIGRPLAHVLVGDGESVSQYFAEAGHWDREPHRDVTRVLLLGDEDPAPGQREDLRLALDCSAGELVAAIQGLGCRLAPMSSASVICVARGGLAPGALRRVREHIQRRLSKRIELAELAEMAGLSECHFARAFKQSMGMPPHRYILQRRIEAAALLIERTDQPLSEIALEVGFSDQSHFTRMFSRIARQTPRAFRTQCR